MASLYNTIGQKTDKNLLADPVGAKKTSVPMYPGNGELEAGTLLYRTADGYWAPAASGQINGSYQLAVLKEAVDTGETLGISEDGIVYTAGSFLPGAITLNGGGSLSEAHKVILRGQNIVFDKGVGAGDFDNTTVNITYKANNGADPAEDDVVIPALKGSTYTILNNSASELGFTAPATKAFSKWNTKADGTGTDYSAAATYTANADLTLYAVWA